MILLKYIYIKLYSLFINYKTYKFNLKLKKTKNVSIYEDVNLKFAKVDFEGNNFIPYGTKLSGNIKLGYATNLGIYNELVGNIEIGKFCQIAGFVSIHSGNHPIDYLSIYTGSRFLNGKLNNNIILGKVEIGNDVWIGTGVKILKDVKIGDGAIIAAGAVVTKDVPPYAIVGGIPSKVIKYRFSNDIIEELLTTKWWNCKIENLEKNHMLFTSPIKSFEDVNNIKNNLEL